MKKELKILNGKNELKIAEGTVNPEDCAYIEVYDDYYGHTTFISLTNKECVEIINFLNRLSLNHTHKDRS